jgi:hypothetical protein
MYEENGVEITTHSMLKSFQRCPKQAQYKYHERLKKKTVSARDKPLRRGTWLHSLLEEHYMGRSWQAMHKRLSAQYSELFDEEKDALGDLPTECAQIMRSYLWHYGADKDDPLHGWRVIDAETTLECPWPDGRGLYRGRTDLIVEDEYGLWIVDHKSHKTLPDMTFRLLDYASALYIWAARENGYPVRGFIWNYLRTKAPTQPKMVYVGKPQQRLSTAAMDTDYPTAVRTLKSHEAEYGLDITPHKPWLRQLRDQRWEPGKAQTSPFFRRDILEKDDEMIARVVAAAMHTRDRMHEYPFDEVDVVERVVDRSCTYFCDFRELCTTELFGGNALQIRRQQFKVGDPMDYYRDKKDEEGSASD